MTNVCFVVLQVDCTLPADHPYHQALGLRSGSDTSLVRKGSLEGSEVGLHGWGAMCVGGRTCPMLCSARLRRIH